MSRVGLVLATTQTQARYALPPVITAFRDRFPEIDFELHQGSSEQIAPDDARTAGRFSP